VWVTSPGFPLTRIDPKDEKVVQQFYGEGGGAIAVGQGWIWLAKRRRGHVVEDRSEARRRHAG
jgi:hypothetical protein